MTANVQPASNGRIIVGVDGSPASEAALRWAVTAASVTGGHIVAVTTWQIPVTYGWALMSGGWAPDKAARKLLDETIESVFGGERPAGLRTIVEEGNAAKVLIKHSEGAQMLVVGSRGLGGFAGLLLGSVSATCAEHAKCPVLVIHGSADAAEPEPSYSS